MAEHWYVIQTNYREEELAASELKKNGFKIFLPVFINRTKSNPNGIKQAVFPSYLFVRLDLTVDKAWRTINRMRGVSRLIGFTEDYFSSVPDGVVENIIDKADNTGVLLLEDLNPALSTMVRFYNGMPVKITGFKYANIPATYCYHKENRVHVLLTLLNRKIEVSLPIDNVVPISDEVGNGGA